ERAGAKPRPGGQGGRGDPRGGRRGPARARGILPRSASRPRGGEVIMSRIPPVPRLPYLLLGGLTLVCFGGPVAMLVIVRGGPSSDWPPDRAVEWLVIGLVFGLVVVLFSACGSGSWG